MFLFYINFYLFNEISIIFISFFLLHILLVIANLLIQYDYLNHNQKLYHKMNAQ